MDIALNKDFEIIKKASSTVLCNELSRCVYEGYKKSSKRKQICNRPADIGCVYNGSRCRAGAFERCAAL